LANRPLVLSLVRAVSIELEEALAVPLKGEPLAIDAGRMKAAPLESLHFEATDEGHYSSSEL
jgi:hypothetical protein